MAPQWYWMQDDRKQGPTDTAGLKRLAKNGKLKPTDMIWRDGLPGWVHASQAKGLFLDHASAVTDQTAPVSLKRGSLFIQFRHFLDVQGRRRLLTWFFIILGLAWMAILGYLAVASHMTFFAMVRPSLIIQREQAQGWCLIGATVATGLWMLVALLLYLSASRMLPKIIGAHLASGGDDGLLMGVIDNVGRQMEQAAHREDRRLDAVIEDMRIASGAARPRRYVLESSALNAFAVGSSVEKGAVVVTRGLLQSLTRDELQAVVAHEMAHLKNGDALFVVEALAFVWMAMAACAIAAGVAVVMIVVGVWLTYALCQGIKSAGNIWVQLAAGIALIYFIIMGVVYILAYVLLVALVLALVVIGIKAASSAISQSREYLADACAWQWTRYQNPFALASALEKVSGMSRVQGIRSNAVASLWLAYSRLDSEKGIRQRFFSYLLHTHPPMDGRLQELTAMAGSVARTEASGRARARLVSRRRFSEWAFPTLATVLAVVTIPAMLQLDLSTGRRSMALHEAPQANHQPGQSAASQLTPPAPFSSREAMTYFMRGRGACQRGDFDKAIADCSKAIELSPDNPLPYKERCLAYTAKAIYDKAWADLKECEKLCGHLESETRDKLSKASGRSE